LISELFAESIDLAELSLEIENRLGLAYQIDTGAIASLNEKRNGTWDLTLSDLITFVSDKQHARSPEIANRDRTLNVSDHSGS
jgi:acyl carrier protein